MNAAPCCSERLCTPRPAPGSARGSWMALLAATTLGITQVGRVRAEVTTAGAALQQEAERAHRLIVQAYAPESLDAGLLPRATARPLASTQRAVTFDELRAGMAVDVLQLEQAFDAPATPWVLAWVEPGDPDLEFDALLARPSPGERYWGAARANGAGASTAARVVLGNTPA